MDRAVLRPGRFGKLLYVPLPTPDERGLILKALARKKPVDPSVDLTTIGRMEACENLSGADLAALVCLYFIFMFSFFFVELMYIYVIQTLTSSFNSNVLYGYMANYCWVWI